MAFCLSHFLISFRVKALHSHALSKNWADRQKGFAIESRSRPWLSVRVMLFARSEPCGDLCDLRVEVVVGYATTTARVHRRPLQG